MQLRRRPIWATVTHTRNLNTLITVVSIYLHSIVKHSSSSRLSVFPFILVSPWLGVLHPVWDDSLDLSVTHWTPAFRTAPGRDCKFQVNSTAQSSILTEIAVVHTPLTGYTKEDSEVASNTYWYMYFACHLLHFGRGQNIDSSIEGGNKVLCIGNSSIRLSWWICFVFLFSPAAPAHSAIFFWSVTLNFFLCFMGTLNVKMNLGIDAGIDAFKNPRWHTYWISQTPHSWMRRSWKLNLEAELFSKTIRDDFRHQQIHRSPQVPSANGWQLSYLPEFQIQHTVLTWSSTQTQNSQTLLMKALIQRFCL